jgi:hypothetical protein
MWALERVNLLTPVENLTFEKQSNIYPNPTNGNFTIALSNFEAGENVSVSIFNMTGQELFEGSFGVDGKGFVSVDLKSADLLPSGNYCVTVKGNSAVSRAKLMIFR